RRRRPPAVSARRALGIQSLEDTPGPSKAPSVHTCAAAVKKFDGVSSAPSTSAPAAEKLLWRKQSAERTDVRVVTPHSNALSSSGIGPAPSGTRVCPVLSYTRRRAASDRTAYASAMAMNRSAASGAGLVSG